MNQISPKIFEAIRLRTALILFEGEYSDIVKPDQHYIPLEKDFSNVAEVFAKVSDLRYLETLTARAYDEMIVTGRYSYAAFVDGIDRYIERQRSRGPRATIFSAPVIAHYREGRGRGPIDPTSPLLLDGVRIESVDPRSFDWYSPTSEITVLIVCSRSQNLLDRDTGRLVEGRRR